MNLVYSLIRRSQGREHVLFSSESIDEARLALLEHAREHPTDETMIRLHVEGED